MSRKATPGAHCLIQVVVNIFMIKPPLTIIFHDGNHIRKPRGFLWRTLQMA